MAFVLKKKNVPINLKTVDRHAICPEQMFNQCLILSFKMKIQKKKNVNVIKLSIS